MSEQRAKQIMAEMQAMQKRIERRIKQLNALNLDTAKQEVLL